MMNILEGGEPMDSSRLTPFTPNLTKEFVFIIVLHRVQISAHQTEENSK
jgi:hypothetical protein